MATKIKECSANAYNLTVLAAACEVNDALKSISPRWKMQILYSISIGIKQFSQLKKTFPTLSDQVLGKRLGELVTEGLASKTVVADKTPSQIMYSTTEKGAALLAVILDLYQWATKEWKPSACQITH
jgi:DNA-binding HxlR family transcriptional regulator